MFSPGTGGKKARTKVFHFAAGGLKKKTGGMGDPPAKEVGYKSANKERKWLRGTQRIIARKHNGVFLERKRWKKT